MSKPKPTDYWSTPSEVVRAIEERLGWRFTLDMAARKDNAICPTYIGEPGDKDAVFEDFFSDQAHTACIWTVHERVVPMHGGVSALRQAAWLNPPYSAPLISRFVDRWCELVTRHRIPSVMLVRADTSTQWWARACDVATSVVEFDRRIQFAAPGSIRASSNNFPSAALVYDPWAMHEGRTVVRVSIGGEA